MISSGATNIWYPRHQDMIVFTYFGRQKLGFVNGPKLKILYKIVNLIFERKCLDIGH